MNSSIAIVGMACRYPDARSPGELWENVLARRRAFRKMPPERLRMEDYFSADRSAPDKLYMTQAAVLKDYEFDRLRFRVAGDTYRSADLTHWLALDIAAQALADAGFPDGDGLNRAMTGVVLGNTLTGEFSRASLMRLRWPFVRRMVDAALVDEGWSPEQRGDFLATLETNYKAPFAPIGEESLAGGLSNTIAGRICNHFDFKGGGFTMDGACASSLLAIGNACTALTAGDLDVAIAGGVDLSLDPFELVGFAKTSALAPEKMRVYDERSAGFWPGEGCGFVVLMRYEDAVAQQRRIYAQIRGWGISSDGSGGITRPEVDGQILALQRAYKRAQFGVETVTYFEGHGTGTAVGDTTELRTISTVRRLAAPDAEPAVIGSIKGNFGHTKAAAGVGGLIKATMALHTQILPPNTGCDNPHPELTTDKPALKILNDGQLWPVDKPLRAAVSAMGFGGINTHIVLEGTAIDGTKMGDSHERRSSLSRREQMLLSSTQNEELFLFGARDVVEMQEQVKYLQSYAERLSLAELTDLAAQMQRTLEIGHLRAAIVATTPSELMQRLTTLAGWLEDGVTSRLNVQAGVFIGTGTNAPRIGYLFPGQGTPSYIDGGALQRRFPCVRELYAQSNFPQNDLNGTATAVAQPAIVSASLAALCVLERLDIQANVAVGHSLGEITALHWAGVLSGAELLETATIRGQAMMDLGDPTGTMASIRAGHEMVAGLLNGENVSIACLNAPSQTVISGAASEVATVVARAQMHGLTARNLPVSHAFHSPLVAAAAAPLATHLSAIEFQPLQRQIVSTITGQTLTHDDDLRALLCRQVTDPVQFTQAVTTAAQDVDLFIEVGPGQVLSGLSAESIETPTIAIDAGGASLIGLLQATAAAYVLGVPVNHNALFADRFTRPFALDWRPTFLVNPCELAPVLNGSEAPVVMRPTLSAEAVDVASDIAGEEIVAGEETTDETLVLVRKLIAERVELPLASVRSGDRLLSDLHLNSITVSQIVAESARQLGIAAPIAPTEFANVTVLNVAETLEEMAQNDGAAGTQEQLPAGVESWVRSFTVEWIARALPHGRQTSDRGVWQIIAPSDHPLVDELHNRFTQVSGSGIILCLPPEPDESHLHLLLEGTQAIFAAKADESDGAPTPRFVLVQQGWGGAAVARTFHLEEPDIATCVLDLPLDHPQAAAWVQDEAMALTGGFVEARYNVAGQRSIPQLRLLSLCNTKATERQMDVESVPPNSATSPSVLSSDDVLLITGGGKGITAECALSLARQTGAKLALLGRSRPQDDAELTANLARMMAADVRFIYLTADVTDTDAVQAAVREIEEVLGPVTAILHGAARNVPQRLRTLDEEALRLTMAPKMQGARNLLAAIDPKQLRLFISFGSIIARTGLPGEADYGLANEWLRHLTSRLAEAHPNCRCLTIDWSVWAGAGMGERLGTLDALIHQGIQPIPLDEGIATLHRLLAQDWRHLPSSVVVTGRFGAPNTLRMEEQEVPFLRFLEQVRVHYPGVELVVDTTLSADTDPYLLDHLFLGDRLFPAVLGLEAMAQTAMALVGTDETPVFENVQLLRPVVVPEGAAVTIRVVALLRESGRVEVALRTAETGFLADHFRAICTFGPRDVDKPTLVFDVDEFPPLNLNPQREMYGGMLFQSGRFQRLQGYRHVSAHRCVAEVLGDNSAIWFDRTLPSTFTLGDPGGRDVTMHAIQACMPHVTLLPIGVDRLVPGTEKGNGLHYVHARERLGESDPETLVYDVCVVDAAGHVQEIWQGLRLKVMAGTEFSGPWAAPVLGSYLQRRLKEFVPKSDVNVAVTRDFEDGQNVRSNLAMQRAIGQRISIQRRPDGRPETTGDWMVSASHTDELTLAVASPTKGGPIGCDVEPVIHRKEAMWRDILGAERFALAELIAREAGEDRSIAATRVWTAVESMRKAGVALNAILTLDAATVDGWVCLTSGTYTIAILVADVWDVQEKLTFSLLTDGKKG